MNQVLIKSRRGGSYRSSLQQIQSYFPNYWMGVDPYHQYINIPPRKELIHGDFGKDKIPYFPIRGSIIGDCINMKNQEWKNGMSYNDFRKYILKVDLTKTIQNYDYLIEFFKQIIINNKMSKQINKTEFISDIKSEMTKAQLMTKYELPASVVSKFVKDLGLKLKRDVQPKYVLVDDNENQVDTYPGATNM